MCDHKPKEWIKAMFWADEVLTCKKCGKEIYEKGMDRWAFSAITFSSGIAIYTFFDLILEVFIPKLFPETIALIISSTVVTIMWYVYVNYIVKYEEIDNYQ